jgi:transketolase
MRNAFGDALFNVLARDEKILLLIADDSPVRFDEIQKKYPERVFNFGIAECNMTGAAGAMANEGFLPVVFAFDCFLAYRALEFIRLDICLQNRKVVFVGHSCGVIGNKAGPTHHSTEDIAVLRVMPNLTILSPASAKEVAPVLDAAICHAGPVYIRLGKAFETEIYETPPDFVTGRANVIQAGNDITIVASGSIIADAVEAAKMLQKGGISAEIINMSTIKPLDGRTLVESAKKTGRVLTVEEHSIYGGLGGAVSECLLKSGVPLKGFDIMGFNDTFCTEYGWHRDLKRAYGLSPQHIADRCGKLLKKTSALRSN